MAFIEVVETKNRPAPQKLRSQVNKHEAARASLGNVATPFLILNPYPSYMSFSF